MTDFQKEAQEALEADEPDSNTLSKLMEFGVTLDIDLPELPRLKQVNLFLYSEWVTYMWWIQ